MAKIRHIVHCMSICIALAVVLPTLAFAQAYPTKPIRIIVGVGPGGAVDMIARETAAYLTQKLGQQVIVENRAGASGVIANRAVASAPADGYTLLSLGSSQVLIEAAAMANGEEPTFDSLKNLTMISTVLTNPYGLAVRADLPVKNVNELIALAKSKPGELKYGSTGIGKADQIAMEMFQQRAGIKLLHVPFKGAGEAMNEMLGGRIDLMINSVAPMAEHVRAGTMKLLALTDSKRGKAFPDVPTIAEAVPLPGFGMEIWIIMAAPAKTPQPIVDRLNEEYKKMLADPAFVSKVLTAQGLEPFYLTPAESNARFKSEVEMYAKLIKDLGLKIVAN